MRIEACIGIGRVYLDQVWTLTAYFGLRRSESGSGAAGGGCASCLDTAQPCKDDDPLSGAVQRIACGQDKPVIADVVSYPQRRGLHDLAVLNDVGEARVGHLQDDPIALGKRIDV